MLDGRDKWLIKGYGACPDAAKFAACEGCSLSSFRLILPTVGWLRCRLSQLRMSRIEKNGKPGWKPTDETCEKFKPSEIWANSFEGRHPVAPARVVACRDCGVVSGQRWPRFLSNGFESNARSPACCGVSPAFEPIFFTSVTAPKKCCEPIINYVRLGSAWQIFITGLASLRHRLPTANLLEAWNKLQAKLLLLLFLGRLPRGEPRHNSGHRISTAPHLHLLAKAAQSRSEFARCRAEVGRRSLSCCSNSDPSPPRSRADSAASAWLREQERGGGKSGHSPGGR
ncbi:hypothetical protein QBC42DRAFT_249076 [Cladorrhinum samala]|uniref:Uncharacterized protein n=1 Tax=Cladorrhinum samala TaxID=585594 RepID=A0AAV9HY71_9PEZI|nr:hypothetical protein QBC42DRAFT_249076 [Cladorrhinum samala]